ncbi:MAG TPA: phosphate signaling complex protein PhoU [Solirubrobacteraceae bacterium]|jgi:phosphate transport system protein|nr:phosphate signaling complex protein PhoU [Solirubrobacteraceae bacterium]
MSAIESGGDLRATFHQELAELEEQALGALDIALQQLDGTLSALADQDLALARLVIADDDRIDGRYLETHQAILSLLARQTPVAGDLRLVAALLHLIMHVERIGDQCVNVAKLVILAGPEQPAQPELLSLLASMGAMARELVAQCQAAFRGRDLALATGLLDKESGISRLNRDIFRVALEVGEDPDEREWATYMVLAARALEKIADNAIDIGEQVAFVVTGLFREFAEVGA